MRSIFPGWPRTFTAALSACLASIGLAQDTLTLQDALRLARERNGIIRAAQADVQAAQARVAGSRAEFMPELTPYFRYDTDRREFLSTGGTSYSERSGTSSGLSARWRLLDAGERRLSLLATSRSAEAQEAASLQTLRTTLFLVHQEYYEVLRTRELLRVADANVGRAETILEQTKTQVEVGAIPRKDILQADVDLQNARVQRLTARNRVSQAEADLKATLGWEFGKALPPLSSDTEPPEKPQLPSLEQLVAEAMESRTDLRAMRRQQEALRFSKMLADREAGLSFGIDATFDQQFHPDSLDSHALQLLVTYPLFDGGRRRAIARERSAVLTAAMAELTQAEREARSEIEAVSTTLLQNAERVEVARAAVEAARLNYEAAVESQRAGASDLIEVLTAQISLVNAESGYIEALYDYTISEVQLRLVTGQTVPGEELAAFPGETPAR